MSKTNVLSNVNRTTLQLSVTKIFTQKIVFNTKKLQNITARNYKK